MDIAANKLQFSKRTGFVLPKSNRVFEQGRHVGAKRVSNLWLLTEYKSLIKVNPNCNHAIRKTVVANSLGLVQQPALFPGGTSLWASLFAFAALGQLLENNTKIGSFMSGPLLAIVIAMLASSLGVIPSIAKEFDIIWSAILPLAATLFVLETDLAKLFVNGGQTLVAFVIGSIGTVLGTILAYIMVGKHLGPSGPNICASLCGSYIGGSVNFAALIKGLGAESSAVASAMAADNIAMAVYIGIIMSLSAWQAKWDGFAWAERESKNSQGPEKVETIPSSQSTSMALAASAVSCSLGGYVAHIIGQGSLMLAFSSCFACLAAPVANLIRQVFSPKQQIDSVSVFTGAASLAGALMSLFFCTIGAQAGSISALQGSGMLFSFIAIQLSVHMIFTLGVGSLFSIPLPHLLIASNANVGGPTTAAAMAAACKWPSLVQAALLTGSFGYAIANSIGWIVAGVLKSL
eukprot:jgi/Picsp_1/25/NSC_00025-R1_integral membrane protein